MVYLRKNYYDSEIITELVNTFGYISESEIQDFFQIKDTNKRKCLTERLIKLCIEAKQIRYNSQNDIYYPIEQINNDNIKKEAFKKCFYFLRFLLQFKNNNGFYKFYHQISTIELANNGPSQIIITLKDLLVHIQYCPSEQIEQYNKYENTKDQSLSFEPYYRILITDSNIDVDKIKVERLFNVVVMDSKYNLRIVK